MSEKVRRLIAEALSLSEEERAQLVGAVLRTLNAQPTDDDEEAEWMAEIRRRADEMDEGRDEGIPWEQVRAEGERLLDG
jgi:putative addiction module component (TIGR02574 family)